MIDLEGNVAYIACKNGVLSLDITNPGLPTFLDYLKLDDNVLSKDIIIDGDWGYISGERYIYVIDVKFPDSIRKIGQVLNYRSWSIAIDGDYLFSAIYQYGFRIYDIKDSIPILLDEVEFPKNIHPCAISVLGDWLYIGSIIYDPYGDYGSFSVYNVKYPDSAIWADGVSFLGCPFFEFDNNGQTWILSVSGMGDTLGKVKAICVGVLDTMFTYNFIDLIEPDAPPSQVIVKGNTAAIVDSVGLRFIDISEPDDPVDYCRFYRFWRRGTIFYGMDWVGNYIYLTSSARLHPDSGGLWVVDAQYPESLCIPRWWSHTSPKETVYVRTFDGESLSCFIYGHYGSIGEVKVDGNIAYVFGYDDTIASDSLRFILDSYNVINSDSLIPISSYSKKTAKNDGTPILPSSYNSRMGVVKIVGDTIYASERMVPYKPFHTLAPFGVHNHIFIFSVTNPESIKGIVSVRDTFNMGYVSDGDDIAGDIEPCGNILYSLFSNHHCEGLPICNSYEEYGGLYIVSYDIKRTIGPTRWYGRNSAAIYVDTLWKYPSSVGFYAWPDSNSHALDLLIDGDYAFASAGYLEFGPKEGLWCINVKHPDSMISFIINKFEFDTTLDSCLAQVNGMDIAGDYLFAVGTYNDGTFKEHRLWSIKVYKRNHNEP